MRAKLVLPALSMLVAATGCPVVDTAAAATPAGQPVTVAAAATPARPNVIVVIVDDANDVRCDQLQRFLPQTSAVLRDRGTCFENATTPSPLCSPSRAALQTGQLGHNSGVDRQQDAPRLRIQDTIQADLGASGYQTYGTGKFFNGISPWVFESGARSSGFQTSDFWASSKYYDYDLWDDATQTHRRPADRVIATQRVGDFLRTFIEDERDPTRPFYAYAAFKTPHTDNSSRTAAGRLPKATAANAQRAVPPFRPSIEHDRRDKLPLFRKKIAPRSELAALYRARTRAMYDVDDEMGKTFQLLRSEGILDRTAVIFTSDHGYHLGENGWETKGDPYPRSTSIPLLAFLPGRFAAGKVDTRPVSMVDIAPTVHQLASTAAGHRFDGRSLLSSRRRTGVFFELKNQRNGSDRDLQARGTDFPGAVPTWAMYRRGNRFMIEYYRPSGRLLAREFYADPGAKRNLLWKGFRKRPKAKMLASFRRNLHRGRTCAGIAEQHPRNPCP